jgi:hypothetical protein
MAATSLSWVFFVRNSLAVFSLETDFTPQPVKAEFGIVGIILNPFALPLKHPEFGQQFTTPGTPEIAVGEQFPLALFQLPIYLGVGNDLDPGAGGIVSRKTGAAETLSAILDA